MTKNFEALVSTAAALINSLRHSVRASQNGEDVGDGFTVVWNQVTGQSKVVLYHAESGYIFKEYRGPYQGRHMVDPKASGRYIGEVTFHGDLTYRVRLPEFYYFDGVEVQEFVNGMTCGCTDWRCEHSGPMRAATKCFDCHFGNWLIVDEEIVLFDFDGITLD